MRLTLPQNKVLATESSMWNDDPFDTIKFTGVLPLSPKISQGGSPAKEALLLRVLLIEHVERKKHANVDKETKEKLSKYKGYLANGHDIIETLQKVNETITGKPQEEESNFKKFSPKEHEPRESLEKAFNTHKNLEDEVSTLKDNLV